MNLISHNYDIKIFASLKNMINLKFFIRAFSFEILTDIMQN